MATSLMQAPSGEVGNVGERSFPDGSSPDVERPSRPGDTDFHALADHAPVMIWVTDAEGGCIYLNFAWFDFTGQRPDDALGAGWLDAVHPDDRVVVDEISRHARSTRTSFRIEYRIRRSDGVWRWALDTAAPRLDDAGELVGFVGSVVDISDRKQAETEREILVRALRELNDTLEARVTERTRALENANRQLSAQIAERERVEQALHQAQKMETIGQLTGGIAHDFNNLLTVILGNLETLERQMGRPDADPARLRRALENAERGAERAAALTQRLLAFSRRQPLDPRPVDVPRLVRDMSELLRRTLGEAIDIETPAAGSWNALVDPTQLEGAILNLAVNARDAMPNGGTLTVDTEAVHLDEAYAAHHADVTPGQYVAISVTDTGSGMSREVMERAFEPFFTTKGGQGTGLGLSQVYGFVKQSGGHVKIHSEPGQGTTVRLYLPRLLTEADAAADGGRSGADRVAGTALVVEDDDDVRAHAADIMRDLGFRVFEAANAPAALEILDRQPTIGLVFTDVGLPGGMNGRQLAEEARRRRPDLKVLFMSGYAHEAIVRDGRLGADEALIAKPFTYAALADRVHVLLGPRAAPTERPVVMVVEDEALVRMVAAEALQDMGFRVVEAGTALEALHVMRRFEGKLDAAIIDVGLPDRQGDALAADLRALDADLPIVMASGYDEAELKARFSDDALVTVLGKPYDTRRLRSLLEGLGVAPHRDPALDGGGGSP